MQSSMEFDASDDVECCGHWLHSVAARARLVKVLAGQLEHAADPVVDLYLPEVQASQATPSLPV